MKKSLVFLGLALVVLSGLFWASKSTDHTESGCPFCNLQVIESQSFYEGESVRGILTYKPATPGHVLVVPKRHVVSFEGLGSEEVAEIGQAIKKIHSASKHIYGNTGYFLLQKNGKEAGQSVFHVHIHYVPCFEGESVVWSYLRYATSPLWSRSLTINEMAPTKIELEQTLSEII